MRMNHPKSSELGYFSVKARLPCKMMTTQARRLKKKNWGLFRHAPSKVGNQRWEYEVKDVARQKWSHAQTKAIMRAMKRLSMTTGTHAAVVFIPETLNAKTYATTGKYAEFIRAWSAALAGMRSRKEAKLWCSITEIVRLFEEDNTSSLVSSVDSFFSATSTLVESSLINNARAVADIEVALSQTPQIMKPDETRLSFFIRKALVDYIQDAGVSD